MAFDYTDVSAYQAYVQDFKMELFSKLFFGSKTEQFMTPHPGLKGKLTLTELDLPDEVVKRWVDNFEDNTIGLTPNTLETHLVKAEASVVPQKLQQSYLGEALKRGQDPQDWPFQAYVLEKLIAKIQQEKEVAYWQAVEADPNTNGDKLDEVFDGFLEIIAAAVTATDLTSYTPAVDEKVYVTIENMHADLSAAYQDAQTMAFMSYGKWRTFVQEYRDDFKGSLMDGSIDEGFKIDTGQCRVIPIPGMGNTNRIVLTPAANLNYGFDSEMDDEMFRFQWDVRQLKMWCDFRIGVQLAYTSDDSGALVVSDT